MAYENKPAPYARTHDPLAALEAAATQLAGYHYRRGPSAGNAQQYAAARRHLARRAGVSTPCAQGGWAQRARRTIAARHSPAIRCSRCCMALSRTKCRRSRPPSSHRAVLRAICAAYGVAKESV